MTGSKTWPWCNHLLLGVAVLWAPTWMVSGNKVGQQSCEDGTLGLVQSKTLKAVNVHPEHSAEQDGDDGKERRPTDVALVIQSENVAQEGSHDQLAETQSEDSAHEDLAMIEELEVLFEQAVNKLTDEVAQTWKSHDSNKDGFIDDLEFPQKKGKGKGKGGAHEMKIKMEHDGRVSVADCIEAEVSDDLDYLQTFTLNQMAPSVARLGDSSLTLADLEKDLSKIRQGSLSVANVLMQRSLPAASDIQLSPEQQNLLRSATAPTSETSEDQDRENEILVEANLTSTRRRRRTPPKTDEIEWGCQDTKTNSNYEKCKTLEEIASSESWGAVNLMLKLMTEADFCWRKHDDRGAGWARICKPQYHQHGAFCYKDCNSGYTKVGDHCWQHCPSGYGDWGLACCKWEGWWWPRLVCKNKGVYYQPPGTLLGSWSMCPSARPVESAGLCYRHPKEGYSCTVTACNENCGGVFPTNCGAAACSSSSETCGTNIATMIVSGIQAVVDSALLVATGGASAGLKVAFTAAAKTAARQAAKKNIKKVATRIASGSFKNIWIKLALENAKQRLKDAGSWAKVFAKWGAELSKDAMISTAKDHGKFLAAEAYVKNLQEGKVRSLIDAMGTQFKTNADNDAASFGDTLVGVIDFAGIGTLVEKVGDPSSSTADEAAAWLGVFSTFDPTGWVSVAANFAKPICSEQNAAMADAAAKGKKTGSGASSGAKSSKKR